MASPFARFLFTSCQSGKLCYNKPYLISEEKDEKKIMENLRLDNRNLAMTGVIAIHRLSSISKTRRADHQSYVCCRSPDQG